MFKFGVFKKVPGYGKYETERYICTMYGKDHIDVISRHLELERDVLTESGFYINHKNNEYRLGLLPGGIDISIHEMDDKKNSSTFNEDSAELPHYLNYLKERHVVKVVVDGNIGIFKFNNTPVQLNSVLLAIKKYLEYNKQSFLRIRLFDEYSINIGLYETVSSLKDQLLFIMQEFDNDGLDSDTITVEGNIGEYKYNIGSKFTASHVLTVINGELLKQHELSKEITNLETDDDWKYNVRVYPRTEPPKIIDYRGLPVEE